DSLIGKGRNQKSFAETPQDKACEYGAEDADFTLRLWHALEKELEEKQQDELFRTMEMPLLPVLIGMEDQGILVDKDRLHDLSGAMKHEVDRLEAEIHRHA